MQLFADSLRQTRVIAILRGVPADKLLPVLDALRDGGIRLAEITYDASGTVSDRETAEQIASAVRHTKGIMHIGAGTVLTPEQAELTRAAGGTFAISPHTDPSLICAVKTMGLLALPGAMTVSEAVAAYRAGADYVKLFPASSLGPDFVRQIRAPLPQIPLLAVSGISPEQVPAYLRAGVAGFGIGSSIVNARLCRENAMETIRQNAEQYIRACRAAEEGTV